jgi:uncharacterized SAM-binding protein YcdF (DUF218 family)
MRFILVLGYRIQPKTILSKEFVPTDILKDRLDTAYQLYMNPTKSKNFILNDEQKIIVSGGDPNNSGITEASVMKSYLISRGVNADDIIEESYATNTIENINMTVSMLASRGDLYSKNNSLVIVTSDFHVKRTALISNYYFDSAHLPVSFVEARSQLSLRTQTELQEYEQNAIDQLEIMIVNMKNNC